MQRTLVIATHNAKKAGEMRTILSEGIPSLNLLTLADFPGAPEPDESGSNYQENATIKALAAHEFTGLPTIADDAGLEIDALGGEPGLYSKRFGGEAASFDEKMCMILSALHDASDDARSARFRCSVVVKLPERPAEHFQAVCEGTILLAPSGGGGFGYDPIFQPLGISCSMADLTAEEKHRISHRGKVLRMVNEWLRCEWV